jgi:hypothetical protein
MEMLLSQEVSIPTTEDYRSHLKIMDKRQHLIPFTPNRAQLDYERNKTRRDLILKARQLGISTAIQADDFVAAQLSTVFCATLAHDAITTANLRSIATRFHSNLPDHLKHARGFDSAVKTTYPHTGSEVTIATAGSTNVGHGLTLSRVHGSEVAFWRNADSLVSGILQAVPMDGIIRLESTANGAQGYFYERCMAALDGDKDWRLHFYQWWYDAGYAIPLEDGEVLILTDEEKELAAKHNLSAAQIKWRRAKMRELPLTFFANYPEDPITCFRTSGNSVFGNFYHALSHEPSALQADSICVAGLDWAREDDYTALSVVDVVHKREVCLMRWRKPLSWQAIRAEVVKACQQWRIEKLYPERNSASTNIEALSDELYEAKCETVVSPVTMDNPRKAKLVGTLYQALHEDDVKLLASATPQTDLPDELLNYGTTELAAFVEGQTALGAPTYAAQSGHDDTVVARMLAVQGIYRRIPDNW